jgi:hypothetical protein
MDSKREASDCNFAIFGFFTIVLSGGIANTNPTKSSNGGFRSF